MAAIAMCHSGPHAEGANVSRQFYLTDLPAADLTGEKKYTEIQSMLDFTAPAGLHYYFKCPFLRELTDEAIRAIVELRGVLANRAVPSDSRTHARCSQPSSRQLKLPSVCDEFTTASTLFAAWNDPGGREMHRLGARFRIAAWRPSAHRMAT